MTKMSHPPAHWDQRAMELATGRRYQVIGVRGKTLLCTVLAKDAPADGRVILRAWSPRAKKAKHFSQLAAIGGRNAQVR